MATEFVMPTLASSQFNTSPSQYTLYTARSQPISPVNSLTTSPQDSSPTSPRTTLSSVPQHTRQLRPPKSPLYVPAVLRPTEPPRRQKNLPATPPKSLHSSLENLDSLSPVIRRSTGDSFKNGLGQVSEMEFSAQGMSEVTDMPTRQHWKPDQEAAVCDEATCTRSFTYFTRRHHCRRCGNIFCDTHSPFTIPLDQDANYHPYGIRSRACAHCFTEYKGWEIARSSRSNSDTSEDQITTPATPTMSCAAGAKNRLSGVFSKGNGPGGATESLAASVPRDWSWSTF